MPIVRLGDNHRMTISLRYTTAKESTGNRFNEYLYTLSNGDLIYVSAQGHAEIQSLKLAAGEPFILAKLIGEGNAVAWSVERIAVVTPGPKPITRAKTSTPTLTTPQSQQLFRQLVATIEAVRAAEEFSISIDRPVKFESQDIRALAISSFIEQSRRAA